MKTLPIAVMSSTLAECLKKSFLQIEGQVAPFIFGGAVRHPAVAAPAHKRIDKITSQNIVHIVSAALVGIRQHSHNHHLKNQRCYGESLILLCSEETGKIFSHDFRRRILIVTDTARNTSCLIAVAVYKPDPPRILHQNIMRIDVPQDRKSTFEPKVVKKRQKDISEIDQKIISMYAKGMTTRQISETLMEIYGFEASEGFISDVTDKLLPQIEEWQNRPLDEVYPVLFIDAIHYSVRDNGIIKKLAAYVILGINCEGKKEVLTIEVGDNESAKYWLSVLNGLKNRGVKDILIICADGLTGIREAIQTAFPKTEYQRCIVHQVRNTLKYVADKDRKAFAKDLKTIYSAPTEEQGRINRDRVSEKWAEKYPNAMRRWERDWDVITPIFKFSADVRTVIYTTNAIESLNSTYRKLNRQRSVFPSDQALLKALYLATFEATKKWTMPIRNWGQVYGELAIMYEGRLPE